MTDSSSRYANVGELTFTTPEGRQILYKARRLPLESGASMPIQAVVAVRAGDRLDAIAHRTLGNPLLFWRIADANDALEPFALLERRRLKIPAIRA